MKTKSKIKKVVTVSLVTLVGSIVFLLLLMTLLQLNSMYKTHEMQAISYEPDPPDYWPTEEWQISTPEKQGMESAKLLEMVADYQKRQVENEEIIIDAISIIRNERIVADLYFNPLYAKDEKHIINSCTKSIVATLMGIAIEEGFIESVEVPVLEILNDKRIETISDSFKALTIKDLLAMKTGMNSQDSYLYGWKGLFEMQATDDWTEYILHVPMQTNPGAYFDYSNMASFLLSAIITKSTGMSTLAFAEQHLFGPLGIEDVLWEESPQGINVGFARMWLKPHDMAKIGLLYLQKGQWEDRQVVPRWWVEESIMAHSFPNQYRYIYDAAGKIDYGASGGTWVFSNLVRPFTDGYGYQWWLDESGMFAAIGVGGQYIMVVPGENLIVVVVSKLKAVDSFLPPKFLKDYIIPSIVSHEPIPEDANAQQMLSSYAVPPEIEAEIKPLSALPPMAKEISGKTYALNTSLDLNPWMHDHFRLVFEPNQEYAEFSYSLKKDERVQYQIGLNNVYRITESNEKSFAAIGEWTSANTFVIDYEWIGYSSKGKWLLTFDGNKMVVEEMGMTGNYRYEGKMINRE